MHRSNEHAIHSAAPVAPRDLPAAPISRRRFLAGGALALGVGGVGSGAHATMIEPWGLRITRVRVAVAGLPAALDGLRIAQVSDTHLGPHVPAWAVRAAVDLTLSLRADLVALTGDYVHRANASVDEAAALFAPLVTAPGCAGVVGVLGNHDWYGDGHRVRAALSRAGVRMIDNDRIFLDARTRTLTGAEPAGESLCIAGVGDLDMDRIDTGRALGGVRDSTPRVLLSHNPDVAELEALTDPAAPRVDVMLCGHTHGGQVRLPLVGALWAPSKFGNKYTGGVARAPRCAVVTSRGVGMSILPVRFNCPPEIVEITLTRS